MNNPSPCEIALPIRHLVEFLLRGGSIGARFSGLGRAAEGQRIHRQLQRREGAGYTAEAALSLVMEEGDFRYRLSGRADGILEEKGETAGAPPRYTVDEIKAVTAPPEKLREDSHPAHWAQGCLYAHILCAKRGLAGCAVRLTYCNADTGTIRRFVRAYTAEELAEFTRGLLHRYERWARLVRNRREDCRAALRALGFPFGGYRAGQRQMAAACYGAFRDGGRLLCCAPTGTGKTISVLFPALKALGEGCGERVFYLTAKTVARKAAEDAMELLRKAAKTPGEEGRGLPMFHSLVLTAKDKICFMEKRSCLPELCPYAEGYYDRVNDAVYELLQSESAYSRAAIEVAGRKYRLCPYELSLDLALWSELVIGDYNYLFDPSAHLQRFFGEGGDFLFLVDEAHNLVERGREMHSAKLYKSSFSYLKKQLPKTFRRLHRALAGVNTAFTALGKRCEEERAPVLRDEALPEALAGAVQKFCAAAEAFLEENRGGEWEETLLQLYFEALFFGQTASGYNGTYVSIIHRAAREVSVKLFCLDASAKLDESLSKGRAAVFFSATLQPLPYYRETLGAGREAKLLRLDSPFSQSNLGLFVAGGVSTKYADRTASLAPVARLLAALANSRAGNYIAYFPSYSYMRQVLQVFWALYPDIETLVQQSGMDEAARAEFLLRFGKAEPAARDFGENSAAPARSLLGFCVMGGVFAEGVDLPGSALIGAAVVGVGLPQLSPEPDAIRAYYDALNGYGFEYAYQFPGMNKVLQAAGRVIRTERDRGAVLLIDSRFASARYRALFPPHWGHWRPADVGSLPGLLADFWAEEEE